MSITSSAWTRKLALFLIICAVTGTEVSYHFTLESRFETIEEKLVQQTAAMQAMQESLDSTETSKNETLSGLNKQLAALESSFAPLGKATQAQSDALNQLHQQLASLQQAQTSQQDAQKQLSAYIDQLQAGLKKARADAAAGKSAPGTTPATSTSSPIPDQATPPSTNAPSDLMSLPGAISHPADRSDDESMATETLPTPTAPRARAVMELRPADSATAMNTAVSPRALPVSNSIAR